MRFGVFTMPEHPPWENWNLSYDLDLEKTKYIEHLGFEEHWYGEHHAGGFENVPVPEYYIARASVATSRMRLGLGTVNLPYHDPFLVAERLAFLDQLTKGRLIYGLGGGGLKCDQELFNTFETSNRRFDEALEVVRRLWSASEPISHEGEFYRFENRELQVRPYQECPQIAVAGLTSLDKYALAGANGWMPMSMYFARPYSVPGLPAYGLCDQIAAASQAAVGAGRDPDEPRRNWRVLREVHVSHSRQQAIEELRAGHGYSYGYTLGIGAGVFLKDRHDMTDDEMTIEWMVDSFPMIVGSPDECIEQLLELERQTGGFGTLILTDRNWVTMDVWKRSMELFMRYVAPVFTGREEQLRRRRMVDSQLTGSDKWRPEGWTRRTAPEFAGAGFGTDDRSA